MSKFLAILLALAMPVNSTPKQATEAQWLKDLSKGIKQGMKACEEKPNVDFCSVEVIIYRHVKGKKRPEMLASY